MPPVDDAPVHERTKIDSGFRYGCHNRKPYAAGYYAPDRVYRPDGTFYIIQTFIPHAMSTACRFDFYDTDPHCEGCKHEKDHDYIDKLRQLQAGG